ncbi:MAG: phosphoribosylamine--glycine ligase [Candidatus Micrarchaeia archaeon]
MRVLLVGNGAREHAIGLAAKNSGAELYAYMTSKNPGIARLCSDFAVGEAKVEPIVSWALSKKIELCVVGPEAYLEMGISDAMWKNGIKCVGPIKEAARIEWDKAFARNLMKKHGISGCPKFGVFTDVKKASDFIDSLGDVAIKPAGLTGGKGVMVTGQQLKSTEEAKEYAAKVIEENIGGLKAVVVEEKLVGQEFTLQAFVDGNSVVPCPCVQDHKLAFEGDTGPNTGGMGSYSDKGLLPFMTPADYEEAMKIMKDTVQALKHEGIIYKGFLYGQFMICRDGVKLIEFNSRLGDPEAMNVLPILKTNFLDILNAIADEYLKNADFESKATVCKYLVPEGYPTNPKKNAEITVDEGAIAKRAMLFYASVDERDGKIYTGSSRAIALLGIGDTIEEAEAKAESATQFVKGPLYHRRDVGTRELIQKRVDMMQKIREG